VRVHGHCFYRRGQSPALLLDIEELAEFRDGVIVSLTDGCLTPVDASMQEWMARWGQGLSPSYV
jgi:hypothetical protein